MAVPAPSSGFNLCEKCFAMLDVGAEFCPDCGAPVGAVPGAPGSDAEIYPQLAQANLLRMRGDYKLAENVCLAILHRFPNNATANTLLGDIAAERGDLEHAVQWYELALDLLPDSDIDKSKLAAAKKRISERDVAETAQQLELPTRSGLAPVVIVAIVSAIALVGTISYVLGRQNPAPLKSASPFVIRSETPPIDTHDATEPRNEAIKPDVSEPTTNSNPGSTTVLGSAWRPQEDSELTTQLADKLTDRAALLDASLDPRSNGLRLTFLTEDGSNEREIGARMAAQALEFLPQTNIVVVRGIRANKRFFVASVERAAYTKTLEPAWQETNKTNDKALADAILTDEWRVGD